MATEPPFLTRRRRRRDDLGPALLLVGLIALVLAMVSPAQIGTVLDDLAGEVRTGGPVTAAAAAEPPVVAAPGAPGAPGAQGAQGTPSTPLSTPLPEAVPAAVAEAQQAPSPPRRVRIPAIGLDERLVRLGLAADGSMQVPDDPDRVGWFTAGQSGGGLPTVIAGHVDSRTGPAVFARLSELQRGDRVVVGTARGDLTYVVTGTRTVPQDSFPTAEVFGAVRRDTLRLITCGGPYDHGTGRYTRNLVVTAHRV